MTHETITAKSLRERAVKLGYVDEELFCDILSFLNGLNTTQSQDTGHGGDYQVTEADDGTYGIEWGEEIIIDRGIVDGNLATAVCIHFNNRQDTFYETTHPQAEDGPCKCKSEEDCPHCAWPGCVNRYVGDKEIKRCSECNAETWHLNGNCMICQPTDPDQPKDTESACSVCNLHPKHVPTGCVHVDCPRRAPQTDGVQFPSIAQKLLQDIAACLVLRDGHPAIDGVKAAPIINQSIRQAHDKGFSFGYEQMAASCRVATALHEKVVRAETLEEACKAQCELCADGHEVFRSSDGSWTHGVPNESEPCFATAIRERAEG